MATNDEKQSASALTDLDDDTVKLVAYTIVSLKRGQERVMDDGEGSLIITDRMTGRAFTSWILAKYLQEEVDVPCSPVPKQRRGDIIPADELKHLRVYYVVSTRWPRAGLAFEEQQVARLKEIRDEIAKH